jgi:hypothetical protein
LLAMVALGGPAADPLLVVDEHWPYPTAIWEVSGTIGHRRRRHGRGRKKYPVLNAPAGLWVGVVRTVRDAAGNLIRVTTRALLGRRRAIRQRIAQVQIGHDIHTSHLERRTGTRRSPQTRWARRTRNLSRKESRLPGALALGGIGTTGCQCLRPWTGVRRRWPKG